MDYLTKPFELKPLFNILSQCRQSRDKESPVIAKEPPAKKPSSGGTLSSQNPKLKELLGHLAKAARIDSTILLTGESGTGKTHFAREIHMLSQRAAEEFITVSCPALPRELLESELFGHEKGAFTGAISSRAGRFEQASKGTLFLDEIGDLPLELQPKLLNVLQDREFFRLGGNKVMRTNARVIAATNINLREKVKQGAFREDLYYRLNIIELRIPPLRERAEDIPGLCEEILEKIAARRGTKTWQLSKGASDLLRQFNWPGNIRQLQNVLERATAFSDHAELGEEDFAKLLQANDEKSLDASKQEQQNLTLKDLERNAFIQAYLSNGKNKAKTARELGISERSAYNLLTRYGLK
jgi:DNA-binding NtrC family response regulator